VLEVAGEVGPAIDLEEQVGQVDLSSRFAFSQQ
jgi:hypothetical protein